MVVWNTWVIQMNCKQRAGATPLAEAVLNPGRRMVSNPHTMKQTRFLRVAALSTITLFAAGCASTPAQRIAGSEEFDTYPSVIQEKIIDGEVEVGFTEEMVRLALGKPDSISRRQTSSGDSEVWSYVENKPQFSFGFGVGGGSGRTHTGAGVMVGGRDWSDGAWMRVIFREGKVTAVETRKD
jgi:hypothetical protein